MTDLLRRLARSWKRGMARWRDSLHELAATIAAGPVRRSPAWVPVPVRDARGRPLPLRRPGRYAD